MDENLEVTKAAPTLNMGLLPVLRKTLLAEHALASSTNPIIPSRSNLIY
jgi:hypothetical protein